MIGLTGMDVSVTQLSSYRLSVRLQVAQHPNYRIDLHKTRYSRLTLNYAELFLEFHLVWFVQVLRRTYTNFQAHHLNN
jgi:hypothetical protein